MGIISTSADPMDAMILLEGGQTQCPDPRRRDISSLSLPALQPVCASEGFLARPCVATAVFRQWPGCFNKPGVNSHANKRMSVFDLQAAMSVLGLAFFSSLMLFIPWKGLRITGEKHWPRCECVCIDWRKGAVKSSN